MCKQFGYTKQAYYKQLATAENAIVKEEIVVGLIKKKREIWKRGSGRNLHQSLKENFAEHQLKIGRDKFFDVLRNNRMLIKVKRHRARTTMSYHHFNKHSNLIQNIMPQRANEIWVSDITYLWLKEKNHFCYLSLVTDMYSRKIVGHCVYENLSVQGCLIALREALKGVKKDSAKNLVHHSDRGVQYCCHAYTNLLNKNSIKISMTQSGDPLENPIAERVNRTIKEEFTTDKQINFSNIETAKKEIRGFIDFYNTERPHRSINWLTPGKAHLQQGEIKRIWKSYKSKQDWANLIKE
jgi:transposase InsO family protein